MRKRGQAEPFMNISDRTNDIIKSSQKKKILIISIMIILILIIIFLALIFLGFIKSSKFNLIIKGQIENVNISQNGKTAYIKLKNFDGFNVSSIKLIFTDNFGKQYLYETSYTGNDYYINSDDLGIINFYNIVETYVELEYKNPVISEVKNSSLTSTNHSNSNSSNSGSRGGGGSSGGGSSCTSQCTGRQCGDNGCGGSCGSCSTTNNCKIPICNSGSCEESNKVDGTNCTINSGLNVLSPFLSFFKFFNINLGILGMSEGICSNGTCVANCLPNCTGKQCGNDGCGGNCGNCNRNERCINETCTINQTTICEQSNYTMAFILLARNESDITQDKINNLSLIKEEFSKAFYNATYGLATMNTSYPIIVIINDTITKWDIYQVGDVSKIFYLNNSDDFDFISIYPAFIANSPASYHINIRYKIKGIGLDNFLTNSSQDESIKNWSGSEKRLLGINRIDQFVQSIESPSYSIIGSMNLLIHETGHQWCCYTGNNFMSGNTTLDILQQSMHFYRALQCPSERSCELTSDHWKMNLDGTYKRYFNASFGHVVYHPFVLYFMGLLPNSEYNQEIQLFNAGNPSISLNFDNATFYKNVSVNDIIKVYGERNCVFD